MLGAKSGFATLSLVLCTKVSGLGTHRVNATERTMYIISNSEAIWAIGESEDAAWADLGRTMKLARVTIAPEGLRIDAATPALIEQVKGMGGAILFAYNPAGIACTIAEYEGAKRPDLKTDRQATVQKAIDWVMSSGGGNENKAAEALREDVFLYLGRAAPSPKAE
jgi:hypothetical protein